MTLHDLWVEDPTSLDLGEALDEADSFAQDVLDLLDELVLAELVPDPEDEGEDPVSRQMGRDVRLLRDRARNLLETA